MKLPFIALALSCTLSAVVSSGCALDPSNPDGDSVAAGEALESNAGDTSIWAVSVDAKSDANVTDDGPSITANCSIVQFCNRPNSSEGTVCLAQAGCTQQQAANECFDESFRVCGTPLCPWILVTTDGRRLNFAGC
jgi:hypothetical protein